MIRYWHQMHRYAVGNFSDAVAAVVPGQDVKNCYWQRTGQSSAHHFVAGFESATQLSVADVAGAVSVAAWAELMALA